jgi:hypothetical protein
MDAIEFIHERNRMCATYTPKRCEGCPADNYGERGTACIMIDKIDAKRLVPIVEEWSSEHPRKTRQSVFLKQWPNAKVFADGVLDFCPLELDECYPCQSTDIKMSCQSCRREFWSQEVE